MMKSLARWLGLTGGKSVAGGMAFHPTATCPECGSQLARAREAAVEAAWACPNQDCPPRVRERIAHWCSPESMDIAGVDAALVATLVGKGLTYDVGEIYRLKLKEIVALEGMSQAAAQKTFDGITASMKRDAWRLLFGLDIPLVGAAEAQALGKGFPTVDAVFAAGASRLMKDAVVSEAVAQSVTRWYSDNVNRRLVKRLEKAGVNFKSELYRSASA